MHIVFEQNAQKTNAVFVKNVKMEIDTFYIVVLKYSWKKVCIRNNEGLQQSAGEGDWCSCLFLYQ